MNIPQEHLPQILQYDVLPHPSLISCYIQLEAFTRAGKKQIFDEEVAVRVKSRSALPSLEKASQAKASPVVVWL